MSNKSLKRPATSSIIGYVHHLSPEKRNKNTMDYATFTLQTSAKETKEALIYSKHKWQLFSQSQTNWTPIKLTDFMFTANGEKIQLKTSHMSRYHNLPNTRLSIWKSEQQKKTCSLSWKSSRARTSGTK